MISREREPVSDHYTHVYSDRREQFDTVVPYIRDGLAVGDKCVYIANENTPREVLDALEAGDLSVVSSQNVFPEGRDADADRLLDILESAVQDVLDEGYDRVRTTGEMAWLQDHSLDLCVAAEFEDRLNDLAPDYSWSLLCQYNQNHFSPAFVDEVLRTHPQFLHESQRYTNEYFQAATAPAATPERIDRKLRRIFAERESGTDVADGRRGLVALNNVTQQLTGADEQEVWELVVDTADQVLDTPYVSLWTFDDETGQLDRELSRSTGDVSIEISGDLHDVVWANLGENEPQRLDGGSDDLAIDTTDDTLQAGVVFPIGTYAVLLVATTEPDGLSESGREFTEVLVANTRTALEKHEYEQELLEQRVELSARNDRVEQLRRISTVFREVSRVLVDATTREEIVEGVCEQIVDVGTAEFAWIGTFDPATETITPQYRAGNEQEYLDAVQAAAGWADREPTGRAVQTESVQQAANLCAESPLDEWQKHALKRGFRSVVSLPLVYDDFRYGVLSVYSGTPEAFDEEATAVLGEISDLVANAISSIEQKRSLVSDTVSELKLLVRNPESPAVQLVEQVDCGLELEGVASGTDQAVRFFVRVRDSRPEDVVDVALQSRHVHDVSVVTDSGDEQLYECSISEGSMTASLLNHGAVPTELVAEDGEAHLTVQVPQERSVRKFLEMFTAKYPQTELLARRERERSYRPNRDFRIQFQDELSSRQLEILETAYFSGYFEWPRERTGEEVAESLGVTQPTVNRHLRAAERTLFSKLLEEDDD